jgi:HK97 family phage prohead protease
MRHVTKTYPATSLKAITGGDEPGTFEAVVAVFGNIDRAEEVIEPGAFTDSLAERLPPIVWSHDWLTPPIGVALDAEETDEGLLVKGRLFIGDDDYAPRAREVYTAMRATDGRGVPALREWSVGLEVKSERFEERDGRKVAVLERLGLIECGPCLKGVNTETRTVAVKTDVRVDGREVARAIRDAWTSDPSVHKTRPPDPKRLAVAGVLLPD